MVQILGFVLFIYLGLGLFLYLMQRSFIYFPTPEVNPTGIEQVYFRNGDFLFKSYVLNPGKQKALIYFGGNAESVSDNTEDFIRWFPHHTIYLQVYRGYEGTDGRPSEDTIFADATILFDSIKQKFRSISVIGRSLGSGVASYLAANRPVEKLILVTPFDSIKHVAQDNYPIYPMDLLLKDKFESDQRVKYIKADTLIVIAEHDQVVKPKYGRALARVFPQKQLQLLEVAGSNHQTVSHSEIYQHRVREFLNLK